MSDIPMRDAIGVLLAGGQGERLWPLTRDRAKPAVPFGALYRIIDITLSNCINSDLRRVFVLTQYKALSLNRHIRAGWSPLAGLGEYVEVIPPQMRVSQSWYQGTADAVYQNIYSIGSERSKFVFLLSGDHIYKMNYAKMLKQHTDSAADVTVATIQVPVTQAARQFCVIEVDKAWPLRTWQQQYPPAKFVFADPERMGVAMDSIVASGSVISGGRVQKSVIGYDVRVNSYCELSDSILYNHVSVGRHSRIRRAIIDRHVDLPGHTEIGYDNEADRRRYHVTDSGIVIVVRQESLIEEPESA